MDSDSDASVGSVPNVSVGSAGSSVSSRLQEEYESLLKYALVTPVSVLNRELVCCYIFVSFSIYYSI